VLLLSLIVGIEGKAEDENDPHRPPCTSARCKKIQSFLKARYCGESPFGNGPDDGCDLRMLKGTANDVKVIADFQCQWNEKDGQAKCEQRGQPPAEVRNLLLGELRRLGLRAKSDQELRFDVLESKSSGWTVAKANYSHVAGVGLTECEVILAISRDSQIRVLREVRLHKTNTDVAEGTSWSPLDLADADGDGQIDIILEGGAYENHWLEVDSLQDGKFKTIFSGLGYYL